MKDLIFILSLASFVQATLIEGHVTDCSGSKSIGKLQELTVSGCNLENEPFCQFHQGTNVTMTMKFRSLASFSSARIEIYGKLKGVKIPFPIKPNEACGNYGLICPVPAEQDNELALSLPVLKVYPRFKVDIQFILREENKQSIVCIEFPAKIVAT